MDIWNERDDTGTASRCADRRAIASASALCDVADDPHIIVWRLVVSSAPEFDYISPSLERITGYRPEFFRSDFGLIFGVLDGAGRRAVADVISGHRELGAIDLRIRRPDGSIVVCGTHAKRTGNIVVGISRDAALRHVAH